MQFVYLFIYLFASARLEMSARECPKDISHASKWQTNNETDMFKVLEWNLAGWLRSSHNRTSADALIEIQTLS